MIIHVLWFFPVKRSSDCITELQNVNSYVNIPQPIFHRIVITLKIISTPKITVQNTLFKRQNTSFEHPNPHRRNHDIPLQYQSVTPEKHTFKKSQKCRIKSLFFKCLRCSFAKLVQNADFETLVFQALAVLPVRHMCEKCGKIGLVIFANIALTANEKRPV